MNFKDKPSWKFVLSNVLYYRIPGGKPCTLRVPTPTPQLGQGHEPKRIGQNCFLIASRA